MAFYMEKMTVRDMKTALEQTKTVIIPVGIVEQHGYHLPLSTDIINAVKPPELAGDRLNAVVAPPINYCFSGGELLGTVNVNPNVFGLYISEICAEFIRMGFENLILLLGHGGTENTEALKNSLQLMLRRDHALADKITLSMMDAYAFSPTYRNRFSLNGEFDFHAGRTETSLMMYWVPELVRDEIVMDDEDIARMMRTDPDWYAIHDKPIDHPYIVERIKQRDEIEVGVMGFPELATKELGEKLSNEIVDGLVEYVDMLENRRKAQ
ncbi:MAG: creatininase family protein [Clostridia bacterium]|jgi:creatinine amidohydrolase|nr:creatininase family protein [Clostridia bacterium]